MTSYMGLEVASFFEYSVTWLKRAMELSLKECLNKGQFWYGFKFTILCSKCFEIKSKEDEIPLFDKSDISISSFLSSSYLFSIFSAKLSN